MCRTLKINKPLSQFFPSWRHFLCQLQWAEMCLRKLPSASSSVLCSQQQRFVVCHQLMTAVQSHWDWKRSLSSHSQTVKPALPSSPRICFSPFSSLILCVYKLTREKWHLSDLFPKHSADQQQTDYPHLSLVLYVLDQHHLFHSQGWASAVILLLCCWNSAVTDHVWRLMLLLDCFLHSKLVHSFNGAFWGEICYP